MRSFRHREGANNGSNSLHSVQNFTMSCDSNSDETVNTSSKKQRESNAVSDESSENSCSVNRLSLIGSIYAKCLHNHPNIHIFKWEEFNMWRDSHNGVY